MKTWLYALLVLVLLAGGYLAAAHLSGGAYPTLGLAIGGDRGWLRATSLSFWEDIQFKDFEKAASYHDPTSQEAVDIPYLIERMFMVKPEQLDVISYEIVFAEVDSTGLRARVKTRVKVKILTVDKVDEPEVMLYYKRAAEDAPWFMDLQRSLRPAEFDEKKKH